MASRNGLDIAVRTIAPGFDSSTSFPTARRVSSRASSGSSHGAFSGESGSVMYRMTPRITVGMPSSMKSHCQPCRPAMPSIFMSAPPMGLATMNATDEAVRMRPTAVARSFCANQVVMRYMIPG